MSGYTEACGTVSGTSTLIATKGINEKGQRGAWKGVIITDMDFSLASVEAIKDIENLNQAVASEQATYIGEGKFDDQSTEATNFEDTALNFIEKQTEATKVLGFQLLVCACTNAELLKLDGQTKRIFVRTSNGYAIGRIEDDGDVVGMSVKITANTRTVPTDDTPVEYTRLVFNFNDPKGDELNPYDAKIDYLFSEVDQVERASRKVENVSSNGTTLSGDVTLYQGCGVQKLTGVPANSWKAEDANGNTLTIASVNESDGVYTFNITTAETLAYVEFDGIKVIDEILYITDRIRLSSTD